MVPLGEGAEGFAHGYTRPPVRVQFCLNLIERALSHTIWMEMVPLGDGAEGFTDVPTSPPGRVQFCLNLIERALSRTI